MNKEIPKKNVRDIFYRVDGGANIGMGHIYRGDILAGCLKNYNILFLLKEDEFGQKKLESMCHKVYRINSSSEKAELDDIEAIASNQKPCLIIIDLLNTSKHYMERIKTCSSKVLSFENVGDGTRYSDIVINAVMEGPESSSRFVDGTRYYTGAAYKVLNEHFEKHLDTRPARKDKNLNVLISFGGSDPDLFTLKAAKALDPLRESVNLKIVLGSAFSGEKELQKGLEKLNLTYQIKKDVENMAELMWWADIAVIAGGGSSLYEIARMGTPGVVMSKVEHQVINARRFARLGTVIDLGYGNECSDEVIASAVERLLSDNELRHEMSEKGRQLVDGYGRKRVLEIIEGIIE